MSEYHIPVLLDESVSALIDSTSGTYADATFGGGGHSREILSRLSENGRLIAFDRDSDAIANRPDDSRLTLIRSDFRWIHNHVIHQGYKDGIDGVLADLGVSSNQFDTAERGFSFRYEDPLDMRMNQRAGKTAADIVNTYDEAALADIFYLYGELKNSRKIAAAIVKTRAEKPLRTIEDLLNIVKPMFGREREKKELAKVFQALRIEVNQEMDALKEMLLAATELLNPGGRLSVITYHSLEDRIVKNLMKTGNCEGKEEKDFFGRSSSPYKLINNKVIVPDADEQERNPRSRSAKLRIAERV